MHRGRSDPPTEGVRRTTLSRLLDRLFPGRQVHRRAAAGAVATDETGAERLERARGILTNTANAPVTAEERQELGVVAAELEAQGEPALAAEAYARAGDVEGQARALAGAGDVEHLQALFERDEARALDAARLEELRRAFETSLANGRRAEAVALARGASDADLRERGRALEGRRARPPVVRVVLRGRPATLLLGERVVIGRAPDDAGALTVPSPLLSRRHLLVARREGAVIVRDLGARNGTLANGISVQGDVLVGEGLDLVLGGEVPVSLRPTDVLGGAVAIAVRGVTYVAPLGPARLGIGQWRLELSTDPRDWLELVTGDAPPALLGDWRLDARITLLAGDAFSTERGAPPVLSLPTDA